MDIRENDIKNANDLLIFLSGNGEVKIIVSAMDYYQMHQSNLQCFTLVVGRVRYHVLNIGIDIALLKESGGLLRQNIVKLPQNGADLDSNFLAYFSVNIEEVKSLLSDFD